MRSLDGFCTPIIGNMYFIYRKISSPNELRDGERIVQVTLPNPHFAFQGGKRINEENITVTLAERMVPFSSRIAIRNMRK